MCASTIRSQLASRHFASLRVTSLARSLTHFARSLTLLQFEVHCRELNFKPSLKPVLVVGDYFNHPHPNPNPNPNLNPNLVALLLLLQEQIKRKGLRNSVAQQHVVPENPTNVCDQIPASDRIDSREEKNYRISIFTVIWEGVNDQKLHHRRDYVGREVRVEVLGLLERRVEVGVVVGGGGEMIADLGENWNEEEINEQESRGGGEFWGRERVERCRLSNSTSVLNGLELEESVERREWSFVV